MCDKIPNLVEDMCHEFVDQYGDAVIALLVQEIDPSMVIIQIKIFTKGILRPSCHFFKIFNDLELS